MENYNRKGQQGRNVRASISSTLLITFFSFVLMIFMVLVVLPIETQASQDTNFTSMKLGKVIKLVGQNVTSMHQDSFPQVSVSQPNRIFVLYIDNLTASNRVVLRASEDNGNSFGPPLNVRNISELYVGNFKNQSDFSTAEQPALASKNGEVYVGWIENPLADYTSHLLIKRSTNNGSSFTPSIDLNGKSWGASSPSMVAADNHTLLTAYRNYVNINGSVVPQIQFKRSIDGAKTFKNTNSIAGNTVNIYPSIARTGELAYLGWSDGREAFVARSDDLGAHFNKPLNFGFSEPFRFSEFRVAASGDSVYVAWGDGHNIYVSKSDDGGKTIEASVPLTHAFQSCQYSIHPAISSRNDEVYVVWSQTDCGKFGSNIFMGQSVDGGKSFGIPINLTNNQIISWDDNSSSAIDSDNPNIVTSNNDIFVLWENRIGNSLDTMFSRIE